MATINSLSQQLLDMLVTHNIHPEMLDRVGKPTDAENAKTFTFDYVSGSGKNYGTMVLVLDSDNDLKIMYGDNLGRTMEGDDKSEFFDFVQQINRKATQNRWSHSIADINQLKYTMQGMAAIQEGLFEGYYGTRKVSYAGEPTQARLRIVHSQPLGENDARYRHIDRMFIETAEGECFKLGFKSLSGARAMLEHVRQGGKPYDIRGCHITETVNEIAVLSRFNRASSSRILEGVTQQLVTEAQAYYQSLRENLKHMASSRGYTKYFESWHPATITEQEGVVDNIKTLFIEQSIDSRIEAALPLLARIQQRGHEMKEADIFESWINNLAEGTWSLPETPEQLDKLKTLMTKELVVGPDATNATEQLYDLVGDDVLFDRLQELAARDPRANAWNDTEVMQRIKELGIEMPEPTAPGNPAEPQTGATAPVAATVPPNPVPQQPVAESQLKSILRHAGILKEATVNPSWRQEIPGGPTAGGFGSVTVPINYQGPGSMSSGDQIAQSASDLLVNPDFQEWIGNVEEKLKTARDYHKLARAYSAQQMRLFGSKLLAQTNSRLEGRPEGYLTAEINDLMNDVILPLREPPPQRPTSTSDFPTGELSDEEMLKQIREIWPQMSAEQKQQLADQMGYSVEEITKFIQTGQFPHSVNEGDNLATFEEINAIRKAAGLPVTEAIMIDESGNTWDHLLDRFKHEVQQFKDGNELDSDLYDALFDYYSQHGAMPYGVAKARTGDPFNWVSNQLAQDLGLDENLIAPVAMPVTTEGASCNMTAEGEYCPEHGLAECGMGMPAGIMGENVFDKPKHDDPINYNAAITGSYYESDELARIKSLALLK